MSRSITALMILFSPALASAQSPALPTTNGPTIHIDPTLGRSSVPPLQLPSALAGEPLSNDHRVHFHWQDAEVRLDGQHWQLWAGKNMLKDFIDKRDQAYEARRLVADLQLSEHGTIGSPEPAMEFWLSNGQAPPPPMTRRQIIPFDSSTLKTDRVESRFCLRDARQVLFRFNTAAEAQQALAVCQHYGFNEIGLIGAPKPSMIYLVSNPNPVQWKKSADELFKPRQLQLLSAQYPLTVPNLGEVGERIPFDPARIELVKRTDGYHLVAGPRDLGNAGPSDYYAHIALRALQQYPMTELASACGMSFYLSRGQAPRGVPVGVRIVHFDPKSLAVRPQGDQLIIGDGRQTITTFAASQDFEAQTALKVLQHYGFDVQCEVGSLHYLARER